MQLTIFSFVCFHHKNLFDTIHQYQAIRGSKNIMLCLSEAVISFFSYTQAPVAPWNSARTSGMRPPEPAVPPVHAVPGPTGDSTGGLSAPNVPAAVLRGPTPPAGPPPGYEDNKGGGKGKAPIGQHWMDQYGVWHYWQPVPWLNSESSFISFFLFFLIYQDCAHLRLRS